jgi:hypothetical protein
MKNRELSVGKSAEKALVSLNIYEISSFYCNDVDYCQKLKVLSVD